MLSQFIQHITGAANPAAALKTVTAPVLTTTSTSAPAPLSTTDSTAPALRTVKLIMVTAANNNKYYEMHETASGTFTVSYGRVGGSVSTATYPMDQWDKKFREKVAKGYVDQTHLYADKPAMTSTDSIENDQVRALMAKLMEYANQSIFQNYVVSAQQVTKQQVDAAQQLLNELATLIDARLDVSRYNDKLLSLFKTIPRKMGKVSQHLVPQSPQAPGDLQTLRDRLAAEQDTLDVMRSQVELNQPKSDANSPEQAPPSLLNSLGLTMEPVTDDRVLTLIKRMMGDDAAKFDAAFAVQQARTQAAFVKHMSTAKTPKTQLLWHGSRSENWLSILKSGLVLRPTNAIITGKMFGYGIYFADQFSKSLNYTSLSGSFWAGGQQREAYLAIYEVHVGKQFVVRQHEGWHCTLTGDVLAKRNPSLDSVYAQRGKSLLKNEFIVYNQDQSTIRYLVRVKL
ncbi:WGR domain-containing protein [Fibrella forsythiae]|uniref:NAD(+) ADP-ribosyltransferase n=1 Tax=Fibrella forsythiae TaxID=2817061 RepID=A0ABS3JJI6_9BACT|nr:WGR domain-containing protein [Fibrella forsythiae]MBO0950150.1 WGR domain-containing protein [Fibrella forsythiae]